MDDTTRTHTKHQAPSALPYEPKRRRARRWLIALAVVLAAGALLALAGWFLLFRDVPRVYADELDHFQHGSIGVEGHEGLPYWIWRVLPTMFPEYLPGSGGLASLGVAQEPGEPMPIGFPVRRVGFDRVGINCATCHTGSYRASPDAQPVYVPGAPSPTFDPQAYVRFLFACANDPRFTSANVMRHINTITDLPLHQRLLYRFAVVPVTRKALLDQQETYLWMDPPRPDWGPGRTDMNPFKLRVLGLGDDGSVGSTDIMGLWEMGDWDGMLFHTDGLSRSLDEAAVSAAPAAGASRDTVDAPAVLRVARWLRDLPVPDYPFEVDRELAARGEPIFRASCADCHARGGSRLRTVIGKDELGTDPERTDHWPQAAADAFNEYAPEKDWDFDGFASSEGYIATPLDGVWIRAPYLHNGSVPTLADLLEPPDARPASFHRGYDLYDRERVGFVSDGAEARRRGRLHDTAVRGNGNGGHLWGTDLPADDKAALLEYLKTL